MIIYDRKIMSTREDKFRQMRVKKKKQTTKITIKILVSDVGFEPTPTYVDQNTQSLCREGFYLESGALDHSANLT